MAIANGKQKQDIHGQPGGYNDCDLNCDGLVDFEDLKVFAEWWLDSCP